MGNTNANCLKIALQELETAISRHKNDDVNNILSDLIGDKIRVEAQLNLLQSEQKKAGIRTTEETHLHE